ncbi:putative isochorismatase family protein [Candidatus Burarchaeum australiense]|nr:putative isochorismatase family protein [Candidatus Burarchaeum australiense]
MTKALVIIDMVNDFVTGKLKCDRAQKIVPNIRKLVEAARAKKVPVIYVSDAHLHTDSELRVWGEHAMKGTPEAEVISELKPAKGDFVLEKRTYSAFFETGLDSILRHHKVDTVIVTGLHTHICDRHTTADAFFRGYHVIVPSDCVDSFTEEDHLKGLEYLKMAYKVEVLPVDELVKKI